MSKKYSYPFYIVTYNIKWVTTSWTDSTDKEYTRNSYLSMSLHSVPQEVRCIFFKASHMRRLFTFESESERLEKFFCQ